MLQGEFAITRDIARRFNGVIARDEFLEWGIFRSEGRELSNVSVALGARSYSPKPTIPGGANLVAAFGSGITALEAEVADVHERAFALKLFMCREQFFFDGNKRTARAVMNGELMLHGFDGLSIPAAMQLAYNEAMARFYPSGDGTGMMRLLASCLPEP